MTGDPGIPQDMIDRGITTTTGWQIQAQQDLANQQIQQQQTIADQQNAFNAQQLAATKQQQDDLQAQSDAQAQRQSTYDTGRASLLSQGTQQINDAFSKFSPDYFANYTKDYMTGATDDINYQENLANKALAFGLARQGLSASQTAADQQGLIAEDAGRATATQTTNAQAATNQLENQVSSAKTNLLGQVTAAESIAPPVAGVNDQSVNAALDTSRSAITGVSNTAGDTVASLGGVPTVSPLANIFANVLGGVGSYLGGSTAATASNAFANNQAQAIGGGTNPGKSSTSLSP